jgi:hypothetical protein
LYALYETRLQEKWTDLNYSTSPSSGPLNLICGTA